MYNVHDMQFCENVHRKGETFMDIRTLALERCPIRFGGRRKQRFLKELDPIFEEAGYPSHTLEKRGFRGKTRNQIYAFEKTAKLYIAIPYDTPERLFWHKSEYYPLDGNRSLNKNMLATYVPALLFYALILLFVMLVTPQVDDLILQVIANLAVLGATLLLMWLLFHGVANRHNANRNSSAVIAAVDFMRTLDREQKRRIGFVFVDRCDRRCPGAELLASYFEKQKKNPDIIWLNCVGDGNTLGIGYRTHGKRLASSLNAGKKPVTGMLFDMNGNRCLQTVMNYFDKGVMIAAGTVDAKGSLLVRNTQLSKDRQIDESMIAAVCELLKKAIPRK